MAIFEWLIETYPDIMRLDKIRSKLTAYEMEFTAPLLVASDGTKRPRID